MPGGDLPVFRKVRIAALSLILAVVALSAWLAKTRIGTATTRERGKCANALAFLIAYEDLGKAP
ncbi:hypothetical protein AGMMS49960_17460 [Betaproteobacteria bacterium]|nr:hypothetical protein AGMMS49543_08100 [Betaproteobacteria bacterium]GHU03312.1 hypothetical protein AGMMS49960_17460 [Betaproteobacteria bacterium]GHU06791.1 hypothetical protein AGMMS50225_02690 [Betaproteobacteria bacterium]GHU18152.1 hypothetical protein AGMMS50243_07640 [Betaproteobacteria bacterium]